MARKAAWEVRSAVYGMLARGASARRVSVVTGVDESTVKLWARVAGMEFTQGRIGGVGRAGMDEAIVPGPGRRYRRLTLTDRAVIQAGLAASPPLSVRAIAQQLGVHPSTVSREIRGNQLVHWKTARYSADLAHFRALRSRPRPKAGKLEHPELRRAVVAGLNHRFSPQQIAGRLRRAYPHRQEMRVSHETIYQALYVQGRGALRHELTVEKALRSGRTGRLPQSRLPRRDSRPWLDGARLTDRPAEVADRAVPGHWEGDLVVGPDNSGIVTLVERSSRYTLLGRLPGVRDSVTVTEVLAGMIQDLPAALTQTITWDQGTEMARHADFTVATGVPVYFCDPHSPWQRPSNENTNGLIREFFPKGTDFNTVTDDALAGAQHLLNIRPRAILDFATPGEKLDELINGVALAH